jgi:hypothetical protein
MGLKARHTGDRRVLQSNYSSEKQKEAPCASSRGALGGTAAVGSDLNLRPLAPEPDSVDFAKPPRFSNFHRIDPKRDVLTCIEPS